MEQYIKLKDKRILIFQQRGWGTTIGHFLAKKLQEEGCKLAALTFKKSTHKFVTKQREVKYDYIMNNDEVMSLPKEYLKGDHYSLKEICEELEVDSIWPIVMASRDHVRSYKDKYYYSFKQNVSDEEIIDYVMAIYKYMKLLFSKFNPDIIIAPNLGNLPHIMFYYYAKKRGIKMNTVTNSNIKGNLIFSYSHIEDEGNFIQHLDNLNNGLVETVNRDKAKKYIQEFRENFKKPDYFEDLNEKKSLKQIIRHNLSPYYQIFRWYTKKQINIIKSTGISIDYRPPRIILRDHYCYRRYKKNMNNFNYYPFDKIKKFAYLPLQVQPEENIDIMAPYFSNQIESARLMAMSLPGDYTLVVKEHPAMLGMRPPSYMKKLVRTPNIKLIDYRIPSDEVLKRAALVISPNSTTLTESTFYCKPAIQFGNKGTTLKLPNVFKYTDFTSMSEKIKSLLDMNFKNDEYERRLENYVAAAFDTGFNIDYGKAWLLANNKELDLLWKAYKKEIERVLE